MILTAYLDAVTQRAEAATKGPWTVVRDMRTDRKGEKYGLEVAAHVPVASQRPWESAGYVPVAELFHPSNPTRVKDYEDPAIKAEIVATREANACLIAAARTDLPRLVQGLRLASEALEKVSGLEYNAGSSLSAITEALMFSNAALADLDALAKEGEKR